MLNSTDSLNLSPISSLLSLSSSSLIIPGNFSKIPTPFLGLHWRLAQNTQPLHFPPTFMSASCTRGGTYKQCWLAHQYQCEGDYTILHYWRQMRARRLVCGSGGAEAGPNWQAGSWSKAHNRPQKSLPWMKTWSQGCLRPAEYFQLQAISPAQGVGF